MPTSTSPTLRAPVKLPPMPRETAAAEMFLPVVMARSRLEHNALVFDEQDGFLRALRHGFFLLKTPPFLDFAPGDRFARNFFRPKAADELGPYTGFKDCEALGAYEGYFDREHDQWENFYIERRHWALIPEDVQVMGRHMAHVGRCVLTSVLDQLGIPSHHLSRITSGLSDGGGHQMLAFNHFRSDKQARGSKFHRDSGWVTVLRSTERGLLAYIDGELRSINPEPGYMVINFGSSIEVLTEALSPCVRANVHGVVQTERDGREDRVSYVIFLDSDLDGDIYKYGPEGPVWMQSVADFAIQEVSRTYDDQDGLL